MLSICIAIGSAEIGGAERQALRLAIELHQRGHRVHVLLLSSQGPLVEMLRQGGVAWTCFHLKAANGPVAIVRGLFRMAQHLRLSHYDVVHAFLAESILLVFPVLRALSPKTVTVAGVRGSIFRSNNAARRIYASQLRRADTVVCNSPHLANEIVQEYGVTTDRIVIIPNGVDQPARLADVSKNPPRAVVVANLHAYKGHRGLLEALQVCRTSPEVWFIGEGPERNGLEAAVAADPRLLRMVVFLGSQDAAPFIAECQFAIHPSLSEGLSNAILEELSAGLPVIATNVGGNPYLVENGVNGLIVAPGDPIALACAIDSMFLDSGARDAMSQAALTTARHYSWRNCTRENLAAYIRCLNLRSKL